MSPRPSRAGLALLIVSIAVSIASLTMLVVAVPQLIAGANTTKTVERTAEVQGCRSAFSGELVTRPNVAVDSAGLNVTLLSNEALQASAERDSATVARLLPKLGPARDAVRDAIAARDKSVDRYQQLIALSRTDLDQFLDVCHQEAPGP